MPIVKDVYDLVIGNSYRIEGNGYVFYRNFYGAADRGLLIFCAPATTNLVINPSSIFIDWAISESEIKNVS